MKNKELAKEDIFPIKKYNSFNEKNSVVFTGSPIQHPYEKDKFILISDPVSDHTHFFEFHKSDISFMEELSSITSKNGESIKIIKVWIKQGIIALKYEPFVVSKTNEYIKKIKKAAY